MRGFVPASFGWGHGRGLVRLRPCSGCTIVGGRYEEFAGVARRRGRRGPVPRSFQAVRGTGRDPDSGPALRNAARRGFPVIAPARPLGRQELALPGLRYRSVSRWLTPGGGPHGRGGTAGRTATLDGAANQGEPARLAGRHTRVARGFASVSGMATRGPDTFPVTFEFECFAPATFPVTFGVTFGVTLWVTFWVTFWDTLGVTL